jgi:ACT domain-containing protein
VIDMAQKPLNLPTLNRDNLIPISEAATELGIARPTVYRYQGFGLPLVEMKVKGQSRIYLRQEDLEAVKAARGREP